VDRPTEEKKGIEERRTQYIKRGKKESLGKEKSSKEERKANIVIIDV
jgi:hypothetical protein